ncbi:O-antigen polymerase [Mycolicibacterium llatzerense]|uniref:O-antigen polymerase n=1 Tax=Mycolicibacterium llatzerense TaxID=280871 RepID=UPI0021B69A6A|nr:O-antigen polymerase [Mycolicibacterium llatzerense]MCT7365814.1 hypothetical protein [Mycolicibacterium llatzerense]
MLTATSVRPTVRPRTGGELRLGWLSPAVVSLAVGSSAILLTASINDQQFRTYWQEPKLVSDNMLWLFECGVLAFAFGAMIVIASMPSRDNLIAVWPALSALRRATLERASTVLTTLTVAGYVGFAVLIVKSGLGPAELFGGSDHPWDAPAKTAIGNIPGVTALTQVGIAAVVVSSILLAHGYTRAELAKLLIVLTLSVPRSYIYSERLAILELVVPIVVVGSAWLATRDRKRRTIARTIPIAGIALVVGTFAFFEYFRSWMFYRMHGEDSFPTFVLNRLAGYYATAINNGAVIIDHMSWPGRLPYDTLESFWSVQGIYQVRLYELLGGHDRPYPKTFDPKSPYFQALEQYANPEFNNPSGYEAPFVDYGPIGGLVFFFGLGMVAGLLYRHFCRGSLGGLLIYPMFFTGLVEWPRYMYWVQGRVTYAWVSLVAVIAAVLIAERRARRRETIWLKQPRHSLP